MMPSRRRVSRVFWNFPFEAFLILRGCLTWRITESLSWSRIITQQCQNTYAIRLFDDNNDLHFWTQEGMAIPWLLYDITGKKRQTVNNIGVSTNINLVENTSQIISVTVATSRERNGGNDFWNPSRIYIYIGIKLLYNYPAIKIFYNITLFIYDFDE